MEIQKKYSWQVAMGLLVLFVLGALVNVPFSRELKRLKLKQRETDTKLMEPISSVLIDTGISSVIIGTIFIFIGLWVCRKANLGAPGLAAFFSKHSNLKYFSKKIMLFSIIIGSIIALILLGLFEVQKIFYPIVAVNERPSKTFYILASFSAAIIEEVIFRLGVMSLIITVIQYFKMEHPISNTVIWTGIILSSIIFGLIHLPMTSNFFELTTFTICITMIGNLITGCTFGWVYWKWGLLNAMLSHFVFDIFFHVVGSPFA
ncbi:CPBP family intramembrane glutamic endopeptidase [Flavivirga eckloniae]|nr:CPBP family intramembrane glutamic endopeptidase [Flavivirga eckloniae]